VRVTLLHRVGPLPGPVAFLAPLALLVIVWAGIVAVLDVDTRVFPGVGDVFGAAVDSIRDGSLARHVGQSLLRVVVGISTAL
jgi:ABC-type nitrate/sulfonate/bicarbonate transport system permease component